MGTFPDTDCDEFPFYQTAQGGRPALPLPHLRIIAASAKRSQGGSLGSFTSNCSIVDDSEFLVVPSTVLPTKTNLCSAGPSAANP